MIYDTVTEEIVLATFMNFPGSYIECQEIINDECFYDEFNQKLFQAIKSISDEGSEPNISLVRHRFRDDFKKVLEIFGKSEYGSHYKHCLYLNELSMRRKYERIGYYLSSSANNEDMDVMDISSAVNEMLSGVFNIPSKNISTIKEAVSNVFKQAELNSSGKNQITGTATGFNEFDNKAGGFHSSDLIVIAGETSQGKTSLAVSIMRNAAFSGSKIAMYSLEMKKEQIAARMMAIESGIPASVIQYGKLNTSQFTSLDTSISQLYNSPIYFDDNSTSNIDSILASIRTMKLKYDINGAIVDYLQILNVNMRGSNKEQQMGDVARRLKNLAKDLDIWIIALSQLNRDSSNPMPNINRLRDSGQIAEAADVVMFVYRPEVYGRDFPQPFMNINTNGTAMIDVAKGRNIGLLRFLVRFNKETTYFSDGEIEENFENPF